VNFGPLFRGAQIFDLSYLGTLLVRLPQNVAWLGVWQTTFLPEFGEL